MSQLHSPIRRIVLLGCLLSLPCVIQSLRAEDPETSKTKSGYADAGSMEGPDGVASEIAADDLNLGSVLRPPLLDGTFQPWYARKRQWNEDFGLQLHFSYNGMYQAASKSLTSEDDAAGGRFQAQGMWALLGRKSKNPGAVSFRVEDRHLLGTEIPPSQLGFQFGSSNATGGGFSEFDIALTELAWRQTALDGRMKFGFGKISAVSWYNSNALSSALTGFQNSSLRASAAKPSVGRGLGAVAGFRIGENFALLGGIHDANAVTSENPFDTIDEMEFFYSTEFRWLPGGWDRRKWDQVKLQAWYVDETDGGATPSGYGLALTASKLFDDLYMPFLSAGISDGETSVIESDITVGLAFALNTQHRAARDALGVSLNWGKPSDNSLNEQWTSELFYRFQLFKNLAITPSLQFVANPTYSPEDDTVWLGGIRARMTF